ncbi:MAG: sulfatase-like hydrolase/transferase [Bryobacterales bacterium]|nr:sulfatase-like hydrolase/transferase [Bryobacterales bacterium]
MKLNRRQLLAGSTAAPFLNLGGKGATRRTNVVMFMTDDHGAWAMGAGGCGGVHTPNLDRLGEEGARFTRAYACTPVCSPSRMTFLTGMLPSHHGVQDYLRPEDGLERWLHAPAYSQILADGGYAAGVAGKWHMGADDTPQAGFRYWVTTVLFADGKYPKGSFYKDPEFFRNGKRTRVPGFRTDAEADFAIEFLEGRKGKSEPFYLLVTFDAPHMPYDYQPGQDRAPYAELDPACFPNTPMNFRQMAALKKDFKSADSRRSYAALVTGVDRNVGRIVKRLEELGLRDDTLIVFTADQGHCCGHHGVWGKGNGTVPFNMYEESIRVPLIWNHPGRIQAGQTLSPMVSSYDYFPTILDYLGTKAPPDARRAGRSYAGFLHGQKQKWRNRLYFEYEYTRALRTENLKYIERTSEWPSEMFDLEADPGETRSVLDDAHYRGQRQALRADLDRFFAKAGAPALDQWRSTTKQVLREYSRVAPGEPHRPH